MSSSGPELLDASAVADLLTELGQRTELAGDSPYKARAYYKAAESLNALTEPLDAVVSSGRVREIPGVGRAIEEKIAALHRTGTHPTLERLRGEFPPGVLEMLGIPGLGADKVRQLHKQLGIATIDELESGCRQDQLRDVKGFGPAVQARILQGIEMKRQSRGQRLIHRAGELLEAAQASLTQAHPELSRIVAAGDYRRGCELVSDLSLVAELPAGASAAQLTGEIRLHVAERAHYGAALFFATGSSEHLRQLTAYAAERGFKLDGSGLRRGRRRVPCETEAELYAALGLSFIAPELREGLGEIELAAENRLPRLVEDGDLRGLLHSHTDLSDGSFTLVEMAAATRQRGYSYYGVADHSRSAGYAGGLTLDEIKVQHEQADALNAQYGGTFRILKGIESDILQDGALDYPDEVLESFDFVVASVHSRFALDEPTQTARIIRAVSNPFTTILGHMTGRLLLRRPGYQVDIDEILQTCAHYGVAVEINANPHRLDLDWRWHQRALELGCMLSINPDAHSIAELDLTRWGVLMARKGRVPRERVLNCLELGAIMDHLDTRRSAR